MDNAASEKVFLVPWDHKSEVHLNRMTTQRIACGWRQNEIAEWADNQVKGTKMMYWLVLSDDLPNKQTLLEQHRSQYPDEATPIQDTATEILAVPRAPTNTEFTPIGHIGLRKTPDLDAKLGLPTEGVLWITSLYVSWAIQSGGLGRSAMRQLEVVATQPPQNATIMVLDTMPAYFQKRADVIKTMYTDRGMPVPPVLKTNEEWYVRQGYEIFSREDPDSNEWALPTTGQVIKLPILYLKKKLV